MSDTCSVNLKEVRAASCECVTGFLYCPSLASFVEDSPAHNSNGTYKI